jgi:hypothetical protein
MLGLDWIDLALEDLLGLGLLLLMVLMMFSLAVWFAHSVVEHLAKMGRGISCSNYQALLKENERLRDSLVEAREENAYLRKLYRDLPSLRPRAEDGRQNAA